MSKIVAVKDIGVPVPTDPTLALALVCYYGPKGFSPQYNQSARVVVATANLTSKTVGTPSVSVYDFQAASALPANLPSGPYDFYFTFCDTADGTGSESDFSPVVSETIDNSVPPTPGQPIILG